MDYTITNRHEQHVVVLIEEVQAPRGIAIVAHGTGGYKEQLHIAAMAQACKDAGYTTVRYDATDSLGASGGRYEEATTGGYYEDLEDVAAWVREQSWASGPLVLAGQSMGGYAVLRYAQLHPGAVQAVIGAAPVVSGRHSMQAHAEHNAAMLATWQATGWREEVSVSRPGRVKRLPWSHMEERQQHDLLPDVAKLANLPVLLIVGDQDTTTPTKHTEELYDAIPGDNKQLHIMAGAPHNFRKEHELQELQQVINNWLAIINR